MADIREALKLLQSTRDRAKHELTQLDEAIRTLQELAVRNPRPQTLLARKPRRRMSAAARKKIGAAQKARWAKARRQKAVA